MTHELLSILSAESVWQGVQSDRSVGVEIDQTWINKGQDCHQEESPVACEDLPLNKSWEGESGSKADSEIPGEAGAFPRVLKISTLK